MKVILSIILTLFTLPALAKTEINFLVGALTYHYDRNSTTKDGRKLNETNELLGVQYNNWTVSYFKNSYYKDTYLFGYHFNGQLIDNINLGLLLGGMYGYDDDEKGASVCFGDYCAMGAATIKYTRWDIQPTLLITPSFTSFLISYKFQ